MADHILKSAEPILKLYPEPEDTKLTESDEDEIYSNHPNKLVMRKKRKKVGSSGLEGSYSTSRLPRPSFKIAKKDQDMLYLANGYAVSSKFVESIKSQ